jgi:sugar lactone lactonase YvrE
VDSANYVIRKITSAGVVSTFAGSGIGGFADGIASVAQFNGIDGLAVDTAGNVYVADTNNHRVRKISPAGVVSTLAGSTQGYANGTGTAARFNNPSGVAVDAAGNVFVTDTFNYRIRKITPAGVVSTLAGSGIAGFANGSGTAAQFNKTYGIAVNDAGSIFVADALNHRIRKITASGVVTTLAGSVYGYANGNGTAAKFSYPYGITVDATGTVYVTDAEDNRIRKITIAGMVSTLAGSGIGGFADGIGTTAQFINPCGVSVDAVGSVFISDATNHRIRKITNSLSTSDYHQNQVLIYPNPVSSIINIDLGDSIASKVILFDMNGRVMQTENIVNSSGIEISNLANGMYLMQITTDKGVVSKKIMKK